MSDHPIQGLMSTSMQSIKEMVDVNTIVGEPVEAPDGTVIIPISKVGFGFCAAGTDYNNQKSNSEPSTPMFGGGSGAGVSIKPVGFLVVGQGQIKLLPVDGAQSTPIDRILEYVPELIEKLNGKIQKSKDEKKAEKDAKKEEKESSKEAKVKAEIAKNIDQIVKTAKEADDEE